jgi:hypothetical protein
VSFSRFTDLGYSPVDAQILTEAHRLASRTLNCHFLNHEQSKRLSQTIVKFFNRGIHDVGVLSTLAANREKALRTQAAKLERKLKRQSQLENRKSRVLKQPENRAD